MVAETISLGWAIRQAYHALRLELDTALRPLGLTLPQLSVLEELDREPGLSGAELARRYGASPQTMNAIIARMEVAGLIERSGHPEHGRVVQTHVSGAGRECLARARRVVVALEERMLEDVMPGDRDRLIDQLLVCAARIGGR